MKELENEELVEGLVFDEDGNAVEEIIYDKDGNEVGKITTEIVEEISDEEAEKTTGGEPKYKGQKNHYITLSKAGKSKVIWGFTTYMLNVRNQNKDLISTSFWGGRAGVKITRKSSKRGRAVVKFQERHFPTDTWYEVVVTIQCT